MLECLLAAEGRPVSAEELLERVWDEDADPFTTTVKTTVGRLRAKLGRPAADRDRPRGRLPHRRTMTSSLRRAHAVRRGSGCRAAPPGCGSRSSTAALFLLRRGPARVTYVLVERAIAGPTPPCASPDESQPSALPNELAPSRLPGCLEAALASQQPRSRPSTVC